MDFAFTYFLKISYKFIFLSEFEVFKLVYFDLSMVVYFDLSIKFKGSNFYYKLSNNFF